jgi:hypothetical protein
MKSIFVALFLIITNSMAYAVPNTPVLAEFDVNCVGNSRAPRGTLNVKFDGTISVVKPNQTGTLKLGSVGVFDFFADFKFHLGQKNDGVVTFAFQNAQGTVLTKSTFELPKNGIVKTAVYYFDTASNTTANIYCKVTPVPNL